MIILKSTKENTSGLYINQNRSVKYIIIEKMNKLTFNRFVSTIIMLFILNATALADEQKINIDVKGTVVRIENQEYCDAEQPLNIDIGDFSASGVYELQYH